VSSFLVVPHLKRQSHTQGQLSVTTGSSSQVPQGKRSHDDWPEFARLLTVKRYQYDTGSIADDIASQTHQTFVNIEAALQRAGSSTKDIVRVRYIVPNASDFPKCWPVIRQWLGDVQPAATMIEAGLMEKAMLIEIEVTACKGKIDGGKSAPPM
jgi:enamine deaminase RidA (YjgF/YER057c/UK114 family)